MNHRIRPGFIALDALSLFLYIIYQCPGSSRRQPSPPLPPIVLLVSVINTGVKRSRIIDEECERVGERPDDRHCPINISNSSFIHCRRAVDDDDAVFETTSQPSPLLLLHYYPPSPPFSFTSLLFADCWLMARHQGFLFLSSSLQLTPLDVVVVVSTV